MSFILDALKKSETERAQQSGPTLVDPRIVSPRRGIPAWVIVLSVVLLANLAVLAMMLVRSTHRDAAIPSATVALPATPILTPAPAEPQPTNVLPPPTLPIATTPASTSSTPLPAAYVEPRPLITAPSPMTDTESLATGRVITPSSAAPEPITVVRSPPQPYPDPSGLPTAEDLRVSGIGLPPLNMALHAFDPSPPNRYVLLNGQKLREGQSTGDGVEIEQITDAGAVLRWHQQRFLLTPGN
jgi:general secretion pathway protein B